MARIRVLTALKIKQNLKPGMYADGLGLYLKVRAGNSKSWIFRYRTGGRLRDMGLGPFHTVSLAEAREQAEVCRATRLKGLDPLDERHKEQQARVLETTEAITFEKCAEAYIAAHRAGWKNGKHADQWKATLQTYVYPVFKDKPVAAIDDALVLKVLQPIWKDKTETASRLRGRIERILDWARVMKYRTGDNPARWKGHLDHLLPKRSKVAIVNHHAALPIDETPDFVLLLQREQTVVARAFEFCILNATRTNETMGMRWDEFDEKAQLWTVPAARMKASRDHRIPLAKRSQIILAEMKEIRTGDFVFPGKVEGHPLSSMAFLMLLRRLERDDITAHGFRSTFRDWAAERTDFPSEVVEMALAHTISNKVEAAYRRGDLFDKRRQLAEAWAAFCGGTAPSKP
ncbi:integrase arm-type DNA-binding domain-containing protein [Bradyrhizobium diazoefficiens]|nr:integrase arm-type DNA-binding domain-containing protein [Bradyrhizobium diazoefficiens]QQO18604.1 integrase arm-type DNA-binding domain-containing protein [Bradyrhizobium diazoefficiens]